MIYAFALYMLPTIIGAARKVVNVGSVFAINLLLGWTLIGWANRSRHGVENEPAPRLPADVDATAASRTGIRHCPGAARS